MHKAGDILAAFLYGLFHSHGQAAAAGHLHTGNGDASDVVFGDYLCEFFCVVTFVKLRAANEGYSVPDEIDYMLTASSSVANLQSEVKII